eukprot:1196020-Rhodomonas_salina.1
MLPSTLSFSPLSPPPPLFPPSPGPVVFACGKGVRWQCAGSTASVNSANTVHVYPVVSARINPVCDRHTHQRSGEAGYGSCSTDSG